ncbi:hypothetical protein ACRAR1_11480 [Streptomyces sanyensis]|uniref:hypothetical protein n=1 Tax=Streptomyces sanyensis TaxID=568869 RepID=UPI003D78ABCB
MKDEKKHLAGLMGAWGVAAVVLLFDTGDGSGIGILEWVSLVLFAVFTAYLVRETIRHLRRRRQGERQ